MAAPTPRLNPGSLADAVASGADPAVVLAGEGSVFAAFIRQDSGCRSYGVEDGAGRWFVKVSADAPGAVSMGRAQELHRSVAHSAIVPLVTSDTVGGAVVNVFPWVDGQVLYHPAEPDRGAAARERFLGLPVTERLDAVRRVCEAHLEVAAAGFVSVDLYDGCFLYDFERRRMWLVDLDEYRPGPFTLDADRLPGSRRFMAPEEHRRGATLDERTMVFHLGRTIRVLLSDGDGRWAGPEGVAVVAARAATLDPGARFATVAGLLAALREASSA